MPSGGSPSEAEDRKQVRSVESQLCQLAQFSCDPCQKRAVQAPVGQLSGWSPGVSFLDKGLPLLFRCRIKEQLSWWQGSSPHAHSSL